VYESHKLTQGEELGKPRRLGARMPPGPDGQDPVFGKASQRGNEPGAAELIRGWYTPEEQAPDPDLGKSLHEGFRNPTSPNMRVRSLRCHWCTPHGGPARAAYERVHMLMPEALQSGSSTPEPASCVSAISMLSSNRFTVLLVPLS
jgi:hypothetical protein